jgi:hypothetical protein
MIGKIYKRNLMQIQRYLALLVVLIAFPCGLFAQATPAASRPLDLQIGVGISAAQPDYSAPHIKGITIYGTLDFRRFRHLGIDGEIHDLKIVTPSDIGQSSYLLGPRYEWRIGRFRPYAKALFGIGNFEFQKGYYPVDSSGNYFIYAFGGGVDLRATRRINVRLFDIEQQEWPSFENHGLSPLVGTIGAAYHF